jgi:hydrogenase maturation protease
MKTILVGLGNPILGDDGVGWKVAEEVKKRLPPQARVDVEYLSLGGISLMEHLIGYDKAILIDAFKSDEANGSILVMHLEDLPKYSAFHTTSTHDTSLQNAIQMGRNMGAKLPERIMVVGIITEQNFEFGESLTPEVQAAVPVAARAALELLEVVSPVGAHP